MLRTVWPELPAPEKFPICPLKDSTLKKFVPWTNCKSICFLKHTYLLNNGFFQKGRRNTSCVASRLWGHRGSRAGTESAWVEVKGGWLCRWAIEPLRSWLPWPGRTGGKERGRGALCWGWREDTRLGHHTWSSHFRPLRYWDVTLPFYEFHSRKYTSSDQNMKVTNLRLLQRGHPSPPWREHLFLFLDGGSIRHSRTVALRG